MLGRDFLHEIRAMDNTTVKTVYNRLVGVLRDEFARQSPSTHSLCQCSMLCGAFCRRLAAMDASLVKNAMNYVESLLLELNSLASPAQKSSLFSYAMGEMEAFRTMRRITFRQRLDDLTKPSFASRWDVERITSAIKDLSACEWRSESAEPYHKNRKRPRDVADSNNDSIPQAVRWRLPLRDPITLGVITIPCRGLRCRHKEVFDLVTFVRATQQAAMSREELVEETTNQKWGCSDHEDVLCTGCPVCGKATPLHSIRTDECIMEAMNQHTAKGGTGLCPDDCVVWDDTKCTYDVVKSAATIRACGEVPEEEPNRPVRVVHIEGHVLYAEE